MGAWRMATTEAAVPSYADVQALLRRLAGTSTSDQGGAGRFWDLPLDRFLEASVAGQPLLSPAPATVCCRAGRGVAAEQTGLVRGLRGLAPFDGVRLPRLPFGGRAASSAEIALVEAWVEAGCPGETLESVPLDLEQAGTASVIGAAGPVIDLLADAEAPRDGQLRQRLDIDCLSERQLERLRFAFRELYNLNKWPEDARSYNNLALIHQNHCQHGWERFLPWHRVYLHEFEQRLDEMCPGVTMPYWDFSAEPYGPEPDGRMTDARKAIPDALGAILTQPGLAALRAAGVPAGAVAKLESLAGRSFATQTAFFGRVRDALGMAERSWFRFFEQHRRAFIDALLDGNALWYPLRYPGEFAKDKTVNTDLRRHYPSAEDIAQIMALRTFRDFGGGSLYNDSFGFLDQNPHNTLHIWTGGRNPDWKDSAAPEDRNRAVVASGRRFHKRDDLHEQPQFGDMFSNLTAGYDPVFWPVHANVDRLWWAWQQANPNGLPIDLDAVLTPWGYTVRDTLDMTRFGYEYVRKSWTAPAGTGATVGRFRSRPVEVPERVRGRFGRAEVRLHRVPQLMRSCFVRVFLNEPEADAETPLDRPSYAGYLAIFGHGPCIGGPGHCTPQLPRPGRERDMNAPRNHRVDVTACARGLIENGATTLAVTLVVIGADYQEDRDVLRLDSVSLLFLD